MNLKHQFRKLTQKKHGVQLKKPFFGERQLGRGKSGNVTEENLLTTWKGKTTKEKVAVKRLHRAYGNWGLAGAEVAHEDIRSKLVHMKRVWKDLKGVGLLIAPKFTPILRRNSPHYLSLVMTQLERRHGKLIQGHETEEGRPVLFRELTIKKDKELISNLAHDVAKIHNLGYSFPYPDIWAYYKKGASYERVVVDLDDLRKEDPKKVAEKKASLFKLIEGAFLPNEYSYFLYEYSTALKKS